MITVTCNPKPTHPTHPSTTLGETLPSTPLVEAEEPTPRVTEQVRAVIRLKHYSYRTEKAYIHWIARFGAFHDYRDPTELGAEDITAFLSSLAEERRVAASTQNQALAAILFMYKHVLKMTHAIWIMDRISGPCRNCSATMT